METVHCGSKGWARITLVNMSDSTQQCPGDFNLYENPIRSCGGLANKGCASATFSTLGLQYSQVCGRVKGYQVGTTDAFGPYTREDDNSVLYMDGILIKSADLKQHIWAFATGMKRYPTMAGKSSCPCASKNFTGTVPSFIGDNYYYDSGVDTEAYDGKFYTDPLWTGEGCTETICAASSMVCHGSVQHCLRLQLMTSGLKIVIIHQHLRKTLPWNY